MKYSRHGALTILVRTGLLMLAASLHTAHADSRVIENVGFATPESVEYYQEEDIYIVSNINGHPLDRDGNGFISTMSPSGEVLELEWLKSESGQYTFHAPKGLAISGEYLYVADLGQVHVFKLPDGDYERSIPIEGTNVLNGTSPAPDDSVIVADTGYEKSGGNIAPTGTDVIYQVWPDGRYEAIARDDEMGNPNGVYYASDEEILVVTFGSGELFRIDMKGERENLSKPPGGQLDGVEKLSDGRIIITGWEDKAVYELSADGETYSTLIDSIEGAADLGFDSKRNRLLVPASHSDKVVIHDL